MDWWLEASHYAHLPGSEPLLRLLLVLKKVVRNFKVPAHQMFERTEADSDLPRRRYGMENLWFEVIHIFYLETIKTPTETMHIDGHTGIGSLSNAITISSFL